MINLSNNSENSKVWDKIEQGSTRTQLLYQAALWSHLSVTYTSISGLLWHEYA